MPHSQENRLIALTTTLGDDVLLLASFSGHEAISRLFNFHLNLLCEQPPIDFAQIIGENVTISVTQSDNTKRYFNGIVSHFGQSGADALFTHYQMEVVPWTWVLTRYADCRIFHYLSAPDVIKQVFQDRGLTHYRFELNGTYSQVEYCVQYRETDFNFISRLMEQNGIFYFFEHEETKHTMVIADSSTIHEECPGQAKAGYNLASGGLDAGDVINSWSLDQQLRSGKYTLTDYNFETPSANLEATEQTIVPVGGNSNFEIFDYPGEYLNRADGTAFATVRMQEEEAAHLVASGSSVCRAFTTGYKFTLEDHYEASMNTSYVLTEIQHIASVGDSYTLEGAAQGAAGDSYSNHFTCIPESVPFRPARLTPKPFVQGPQTAVVIGHSEEIWVDSYGRVIVLFPWDHEQKFSCRVRVSQDWAGQGWGSITIPRVGQEVIVSFLEGDPDRPIITGRVYNANETVPYTLPQYQTRSTFKTRSSKGGSTDNYNELRFEDKTDFEQIFLRGEKDLDTRLKNDSREYVGNNRSLIVTRDQMEQVGGDLHSQITGNLNQKVGQVIHLKAGTNIVIEAGAELTLKVGGNFVTINPAGVTIVGSIVMINSGGSAGSSPPDPKNPDEADDGSKGGKMN